MSKHPDAMLQALAVEEFGSAADAGGHPVQAAAAAGISTGLGAIVPVIPFMMAAKSLVTLRSWWSAGPEMTLAGVIVGGATYLVGLALPT